MGKIPNQNTIVNTIKAEIGSINAIVDIVVKTATSKSAKAINKAAADISTYQKSISMIFAKDGIIQSVLTSLEAIAESKAFSKSKLKNISNALNRAFICIQDLHKNIDSRAINNTAKMLKPVISAYGDISKLFDTLRKIKLPRLLWLKMFMIRSGIKRCVKVIDNLHDISASTAAKEKAVSTTIGSLSKIFGGLHSVFNDINTMKTGIKTRLKLRAIPKLISRIKNIVHAINSTARFTTMTGGFINIVVVEDMFKRLNAALENINTMEMGWGARRKLRRLPKFIYRFRRVISAVNSVARMMFRTQAIGDILYISTVFNVLESSFESLNNTKTGIKAMIKLRLLPKMLFQMRHIVRQINRIGNLIRRGNVIKDVIVLRIILNVLEDVFDSVKAIRAGIFVLRKLNRITRALSRMQRIIRIINRLRFGGKAIRKIFMLRIIFFGLSMLFLTVSLAGLTSIIAIPSLLIIWGAVKLLRRVTRAIGRIRALRATRKLLMLSLTFLQLSLLFTTIIIAAPLAILAIPALLIVWGVMKLLRFVLKRIPGLIFNTRMQARITATILIFSQLALLFLVITITAPLAIVAAIAILLIAGCMFIVRIAFNIIIKQLGKMARKGAMKGLMYLLIISGVLLLLGLAFLIIAMVAKPVVKQTLYILGLLGVIILVVLLLAFVGFLFGLMSPFFVVIAIGMGMMLLVVGILMLLAVMLWVIQQLNIDRDKVIENVKTVLDTTQMIVEAIFKKDDTNNEKSDKGWLAQLVGFAGDVFKPVVQAIMAAAFLATMVAAVLFIMVIAACLRLIQELDLKDDLIKKNVSIVLTTAMDIVNTLFNKPEAETTPTEKTWGEKLLGFVGGTIKPVIQAVMAVAFLACMAIAVGLILAMATMLRLLQILDLKPDLINANVSIVVNTAMDIVNTLFNPKDKETNSSDKHWVETLIEKLASGFVFVTQAVMAVAFLAISIGAILLIQVLAQLLAELQDIDLKPELINANITACCTAAQTVIDSIFNRKDKPDNTSNKTWIRSLLEFVGADKLVNIFKAIMSCAWLAMSIGMIHLVLILADQLSLISKFKFEGNVGEKVNNIIRCAQAVVDALLNRVDPISNNPDEEKSGLIEWLLKGVRGVTKFAKLISRMAWLSSTFSIVGLIGKLAETVMMLNDMPNLDTAKAKAKAVCDTADQIAKMVTESVGVDIKTSKNKLDFLERVNEVVTEMTELRDGKLSRVKETMKEYANFIQKINEADIAKLEYVTKMFEHMAKFSESIRGDFDKLAETLSEDLVKAMQDLKNQLSAVDASLSGLNNVGASISAGASKLQTALNTAKTTTEWEYKVRTLATLASGTDKKLEEVANNNGLKGWLDDTPGIKGLTVEKVAGALRQDLTLKQFADKLFANASTSATSISPTYTYILPGNK